MLGQGRRELFARQRLTAQDARGGGEKGLVQRLADAVIIEVFDPTARLKQAARRHIERQIAGGDQMQRAAHGPGLHQRPLLPQRRLHVLRRKPIHPRPYCQLCRRHHLRLDPARARDGLKKVVGLEAR